ncbi:MAG TPA: serine/threonine-protein kinase [Gemmatimonadales bacterium]
MAWARQGAPISPVSLAPDAALPGDGEALRTRLRAALGPGYELGAELGRGAMGVVLRASDLKLHREVAIKVLPPGLAWRPSFRARLVREAQLAASLSHPNIVPIIDVGETAELVWLVMGLIDGETLSARVEREGPQPISVVRRVLQNVAWALAYAHARGVIHRDIKPDNIMLEAATGRPVVTDFGIAKSTAGDEVSLTAPGHLVGTLAYMSPEQILETSAPDGRSDLYSLGLVGYFMLTGHRAFSGSTVGALVAEHQRGAVPDPSLDRPRIPERLNAAVRLALASEPASRAPTAEAFAEAIAGAGPDIPETPAIIRAFFRSTRRSFQLLALIGIGIGVVGFTAIPGVLILLLVGAVLAGWTGQLEAMTRAGFGWDAIRRAIYGERARYFDERPIRREARTRPLTATVWLVTVAGCALLGTLFLARGDRPHQTILVQLLNDLVLVVSAYGGIFVASALGYSRPVAAGQRRSAVEAFRIAAPTCALAAVIIGLSVGPVAGGVGGFVAAVLTFLWVRYAPPIASARPAEEWRLSPDVNAIGAWLFSPVEWSRGRLRMRDDRGVRGVSPAQVRRRRRSIERAYSQLPPDEQLRHADVMDLLASLQQQVHRNTHDLETALTERIRLESGAVQPAGPDADIVLHDRLEQILVTEERLRGRLQDQLEGLAGLATALAEGDAQRRATLLVDAIAEARRMLALAA